jgi:hypothetical protein
VLLQHKFNSAADRFARTRVGALNRVWPSFRLCGCCGLALAVVVGGCLVMSRGLSILVMSGIVVSAIITFLSLVMTTKILTGEERIIYYHHEIAVMGMAAALLRSWRQPILPYLDVTILCIGVFLICGRFGCLMVGCCHGRPHRWGVCYREEHAAAGFTSYYVGVRLFPIQAVESLWVLCIVVAGVSFVINGRPAGTALAWYVATYGLGRFCFEFMRGDSARPYHLGFSQPQWLSLLLMCGMVWAEMAGILHFHLWHAMATACLALAMTVISLVRHFRRTARHQLLHPRHVKEVAEAMAMVSSLAAETKVAGQWTTPAWKNSVSTPVHVRCTSLGIQISGGKISGAAGDIYHYALSRGDGGMTEEAGRVLARLILQLRRAIGDAEFVRGNRNVFHLLIHPVAGKELAHR